MDLCYVERLAFIISFQIVADGSPNPSSNNLSMPLKFANVAQVLATLRWCYYGVLTSL
jgi:hypothetical protein